jgi:hypothetical protein
MEKPLAAQLWEIIKLNMGNRSLDIFKNFHSSDDVNTQYDDAREIFARVFGERKANELLKPVHDKITPNHKP